MNQLGRQGAVVCGLLLGILLLVGCGSQSSLSAEAQDRPSIAPAGTSTAAFGVTFVQPDLQVPPRVGLTLKQPRLKWVALPQTDAPMRITFEHASEAHSQVRTQTVAQHECMH